MKKIGVLSALFTTAALVAACSSDATQGASGSVDVPSPARKTFSGTVATGAQVIGGSVHGLSGGGLTLTNGSETLAVSANGDFAFTQKAAVGARYDVAVSGQPRTPWQTCQAFNAEGVVGKGAVTNIVVECSTDRHQVGGKVFGLAGSGLTLKLNDRETVMPTVSGDFVFPTSLASGSLFSVQVTAQPQSKNQVCTVAGGSGMVGGGDVGTVVVNCTTTGHAIGGSVSGLLGSLVVSNAGVDTTITANGTYALPPVAEGDAYAVTVKTQPTVPSQTCVVANASGSMASAARTDLDIVCTTDKFTVGGTVTGLTGTGLVLQNNGGANLTVPQAATSFAFGPKIESGATYEVSVLTDPTSPWQTCTVAPATGTVGGTDVVAPVVNCTKNRYDLNIKVTGLAAEPIVLEDTHGNTFSFTSSATQVAASQVESGTAYGIAIKSAPSDINCLVQNGSGSIGGANATVNVVCSNIFTDIAPSSFAGYSQCYQKLYNSSGQTLAQDVASACTKARIVMACRPVGATNFTVAAKGYRTDVFSEVGVGATSTHDDEYGVSWYFTTGTQSSIGFAPAGAGVMRSSADVAGSGADDALRLSWHAGQSSGGYRCGATRSLNGSTAWERLVYQAD